MECTLDDKFQMLALVEHSSWDKDRISKNYRSNDKPTSGNLSPDTREFVILVLDGTAFPVRSRADVDLVKVIPVGPAFSCDLGGSRFSSSTSRHLLIEHTDCRDYTYYIVHVRLKALESWGA